MNFFIIVQSFIALLKVIIFFT